MRPQENKLEKKLYKILFLTTGAFFLWRFLNLGDAPFIYDEPQLQLILDHSFKTGVVPFYGLMGSVGIPYGYSAIWLYAFLRAFTSNVNFILGYHAVLMGVGFLFAFLAVRKNLGKRVACWFLIFSCSSPLLFQYSRMAWDNTFLVFFTGIILWIFSRVMEKNTIWDWALLGGFSAAALNTHWLASPFVAAVLVQLFPRWWGFDKKQKMQSFALFCSLFTLILSIYCEGLARGGFHLHFAEWGARSRLDLLSDELLGLSRFLSTSGLQYFYEVLPTGLAGALLRFDPGWILKLLALAAIFYRARKYFQSDPLVRLAIIFLFLQIVFYLSLAPSVIYPHYFMASWWLILLFAALVIESMPAEVLWLTRLLGLLVVLGNGIFIFGINSVIAKNRGTRTFEYGTCQSEIRLATQNICQKLKEKKIAEAYVNLDRVSGVHRNSILYFSQHLEACENIGLKFKPENLPTVSVAYERQMPESAALNVDLH